MGDALCGPSNALQNFKNHTSVDRTLQQERLVSRQSPSQGFRSQNPHEGVLDSEFTAFESNLAGAPLPDLQQPVQLAPHAPLHAVPGHAESNNWASDFQRLQISGPLHPVHQQSGPSTVPASTVSHQGWQNELLNHQQHQRHTPFQHRQPYMQGFQQPFSPSYYGTAMGMVSPAQEETSTQQPPAEAFDDSAFEAAFEQARVDMVSQESDAVQDNVNPVMETPQADLTSEHEPQEEIRIGSDTIPQSDKDDMHTRLNDSDQLARTAGQLLDSVRHDQSQKFKESNFLALMRRIRDREVQVEGDEFCETSQPLHPGGRYYPEGDLQLQPQNNLRPLIQDGYNNATPGKHGKPNPSEILHVDYAGRKKVVVNGARLDMLLANKVKDTMEALPDRQGPTDDNTLYAGWNYGDRWA